MIHTVCSSDAPFCMFHRRFVLERELSSETVCRMARNFMLMTAPVATSGSSIDSLPPFLTSTGLAPPPGKQGDWRSNYLIIAIAYIVSIVVILTVIHRVYSHMYHFTPPYRQAYEELMAARGLVQNGALEFDDNTRQYRPFTSMPPGPGGEGSSGSGGGSEMHDMLVMEDDTPFPSEVLARLEQDLRATSFRERERLAAALNADLPTGRSFFFPIRSNSSRTIQPPRFDLTLDNINRATQSARFTQVIMSPSPASSAAAAALRNNDQLLSHSRSSVMLPRSYSFRTFARPEFDRNQVYRSQSARFSAQAAIQSSPSSSFRFPSGPSQSNLLSTPSTSGRLSQGVVIQSSTSTTSDAAGRAGPDRGTTSSPSLRLYSPHSSSDRT